MKIGQTPSGHEESRERILAELRAVPAGLAVAQLAERLQLHPNTVRWHLGVLGDARLVTSTRHGDGAPGRPRVVYSLADAQTEADAAPEGYRLLAAIFASSLARSEQGEEDAAEAGRAWGRFLVERPSPLVPMTPQIAVERVARLLDQHGFRPEVSGATIGMRHCPFQELAETAYRIVCTAHRGFVAGALEELRAPLEVESLEPFAEPGLCLLQLRPGG